MPQYHVSYTFNIDTSSEGLIQEIGSLKSAILALALSGDQAIAIRFAEALRSTGNGKVIDIAEQIEAAVATAH